MDMKGVHVPVFGYWESDDELPDLYQYGGVRAIVHEKPVRKPRVPKAVDEDLYQIPPELLRRKSNRRKVMRSFLLGCLGLNCIA